MNTSEVGWNRDNYSSLCLLIGMGTFCMFLTATDTKCQSRCGTAQGDQRERCNRIKKSKQLTPKEKIVTFIQKSSIGAKATE
ncbi:hypothetical protein EfsSVR2332_14840 [Enterococcus faecalis]|uniref:Uncharacterized protein n=1 Tax=Enterococcus faecalis TaxID=1351 RepID=A0AC59HNX5_ENTFL|nr:hypothetical protein EfsSVR2281_31810 [Enterococcus faecalis]BDQ56446.1 hypothetical protein EfsSVR2331_05710 [Enterococcus faecalis]BDQ61406.1 hypothetical protein EfsSVR2332_14840 [Enterococcus faecalis]GKS52598.1 hypothetical protein EFLAB_21410 [Enterococcus faecalis]